MSAALPPNIDPDPKSRHGGPRNFRRFLLQGLAVLLPPVLTMVILIWVASTVDLYLLEPINRGVRALANLTLGVEAADFDRFSWTVKLWALVLLIIGLYFLGRFLAFRLGRVILRWFEQALLHLPLVRNVYSSVKQVTDFLLREREEIEYRRVVAVEYPRKGIWSLGLVTGESMRQIWEAAGEEMVSVLIPSSPMPVTGYTINVLRSEVVDLDMSVDQAFQYCISCGVVIPPKQLPRLARQPSEPEGVPASPAAAPLPSPSAGNPPKSSGKD